MRFLKSMSITAVIEQAQSNSKYNTGKSKLNKQWIRFLKNKKLFDEYMIYLGNHNAIGVEPKTYKQISNICHNLSGKGYSVHGNDKASIRVNWVSVFKEFCEDNIKWYHIKDTILYTINNGYE